MSWGLRSAEDGERPLPSLLSSEGPDAASGKWAQTLTVVLAAGLPGLAFLPAVAPAAKLFDVEPGFVEYTALTWLRARPVERRPTGD